MASQPSFAGPDARFAGGKALAAAVALVGAAVLAYLPALRGGFLWDDDSVLSQNGLIQAADGLRRIWLTATATDYWPVTNSLFWIEWRLWGAHPLNYHLVSLFLHAVETVLLWSIFRRLRLPGAWLGALIFAVHPVNAESVAWIAEQKNLVAMLFFLASIRCFIEVERVVPNALSDAAGRTSALGTTRSTLYALSLLAFVLALLSKGSVAPLPLVLLGLVAWRRRPTRADVLRLLPFFLAAAILAAVDVWFQKHGSPEVIRQAGPVERLLGAGAAVWFYLSKALWPAGLTFVYPAWRIEASNFGWWLPLAGVAGMTAVLVWRARLRPAERGAATRQISDRRGARSEIWRGALFAWGYFCVMLIPVLGFTDVVFMKYSLVADRYQHLAMIGVMGLAAAGWGRWRAAVRGPAPWVAAGAVAGLLLALTWRQDRNYRDPETLFRATLARNPECWMACDNLGVAAFNSGRVGEAIADYERALGIRGDLYETHNYLGNALLSAGRRPEAMAHYRESIRLQPDYPEAHHNLGVALAQSGRPAEAMLQLEQALQLRPGYPEAEYDLGTVLAGAGRWREAAVHFETALRLRPGYAEARQNLATARRELARGGP